MLAAAQGRPGAVNRPSVILFAAAHGVARHGVCVRTPGDVADQLARLREGNARLNALCAALGLGLKVLELAPELPVADITEGAALDARAAAATVAFGMEGAAGGADVVVLAGLGGAGDLAAQALGAGLSDGQGSAWAESGALPRHLRLRRAALIDKALRLHAAALADPLEAMRRLGGREIAAMAGAIAAARVQRSLVVLDGEAAAASALVLHALDAGAIGHCVLADRLPVPAMAEALAAAGLLPLLDLGLARSDGRAGAAAVGVIRAAAAPAATL